MVHVLISPKYCSCEPYYIKRKRDVPVSTDVYQNCNCKLGIVTFRVGMLLRESLSICWSDSVILVPNDSFSVASSRNVLNMPRTSFLANAMAGLSENE